MQGGTAVSAPVIVHRDPNGKRLVYLPSKQPTKTCSLPPAMHTLLETELPPGKLEITEASLHTSTALPVTLNQSHQAQLDFRHRIYQIRNVSYFKFGGYYVAIDHCQRVKYKDRKRKVTGYVHVLFSVSGNNESTEEKS